MGTNTTTDARIVYGANCVWWNSIYKAGIKQGSGLPCCPYCGGMLFETNSIDEYMKCVDEYERAGHPGYRDLLLWMRGKCFRNMADAGKAMKLKP